MCVVETGQPLYEAINNHVPAANREDIIPKTRRSGLPDNKEGSIIPFSYS